MADVQPHHSVGEALSLDDYANNQWKGETKTALTMQQVSTALFLYSR